MVSLIVVVLFSVSPKFHLYCSCRDGLPVKRATRLRAGLRAILAHMRTGLWSESIAAGSEGFVNKIQEELGARAGRSVLASEIEGTLLREGQAPYRTLLRGKKGSLRPKISYYLDISSEFIAG